MSSRAEINAALAKLKKLAPAGYFVGLHIRFAAPLMQFQTYNKEWSNRYAERAYALRDPTIAWGFSTTGACRWSVLPIPDPFSILQILLFLVVLVACVRPLGLFMARVYEGRPPLLQGRLLSPIERLIYRVAGVDPAAESGWGRYAAGLLSFNLIGLLAVYDWLGLVQESLVAALQAEPLSS